MNNKFKIRELENKKRSIDKEIAKLTEEENRKKDTITIAEGIMVMEDTTIFTKCVDKKAMLDEQKGEFNCYVRFTLYEREIVCTIISLDLKDVVVVKGVAKCKENDKFNPKAGMLLAELRAKTAFHEAVAEILIDTL